MILRCDKCGKEYRFPEGSFKGLVLIDSPHAVLPVGKDCEGTLRSETKMPLAEIDFRGVER